jgi:site-specific recombinase XerD
MFDQLFERRHAVARHLAGPMLESRLRFLDRRADAGMSISVLKATAYYLLIVADYLKLDEGRTISPAEIEAAAQLWATRQSPNLRTGDTTCSKARFVYHATEWLRFLGRLSLPMVTPPPYTSFITEFADYMLQEKGLSPATIRARTFALNDFLAQCYRADHPLNAISLTHIDDVLTAKGGSDCCSRRTIQTYASTLRSFFGFAERRGWCAPRLAAGIRAPRVYKHELLPQGPSWMDVQLLLSSTVGDRAIDIRDRAILMLLSVYGLRAGEVRSLCLEDLDWERELICLARPKQRQTQHYPLSQTVGEAVLRYLKQVRARSTYREVFLGIRAPFKPLGSPAIWQVVGRRWCSMELPSTARHRGPHALRHACATHLLAQGLTMKEIGDHLGHRNPETTRVYAKVDLVGLRQVADFPMGDLL